MARHSVLVPDAGKTAAKASWLTRLARTPDEVILRAVFLALLAVAGTAIGLDARARFEEAALSEGAGSPAYDPRLEPILPSARPDVEPAVPEERPEPADRADLTRPMTFELVAGGRLEARGTITPGSADRLAAELEKRGSYVTAVVLDSPGGSVTDAIAMARAIRALGVDTRVEAGGRCASSCPLVFAGGEERIAAATAVIGVHQVFTLESADTVVGHSLSDGMAAAQRVTADCQRLLSDMGVDLRVWIHAMDTPPDRIFYFTPDELTDLDLATTIEG